MAFPSRNSAHGFHSPIIFPSSASRTISSILGYEPPTRPYAISVVKFRRRATSLIRDSYLDSNGPIAQYRSEDGKPHPSKMWAQLSPGVLKEILPDDLQYSPYISDKIGVKGTNVGYEKLRVQSIHDMVGVAESLTLKCTGRLRPLVFLVWTPKLGTFPCEVECHCQSFWGVPRIYLTHPSKILQPFHIPFFLIAQNQLHPL
jgi:hypothetical protein